MNYENIKLEKGMYKVAGKTFTQVLEELDPSENYKSTALEGLDPFQRQLKRFGIKVSGPASDIVEKFFSTSDSAALFPEYLSRAIRQGIDNADILPQITATKTIINGIDYRTIATSIGDDNGADVIAEGAAIPETVINIRENLVTLKKRGRMLSASYEAIRFQRLDLITVALKQIGAYISQTLLKDAVNTIISGDGNENPAASYSTAASGTLTYTDLLTLWSKFSPYEMNCILASPEMMLKLLAIEEFKNPLTGLNFQGTGKLTTPLGANLVRCNTIVGNSIVALDKNCALEMVQAGDILIESDKLIDRQLERCAVSVIAGFSKIYDDASAVLTC